ncbi:MAG: PEP-CTERM sorting domain-containing protein, partial [Verrucomicrobia bacterium]|nr:PEP-CTERM sorting domain-containing protein [Verrucomicrobiota bacterium]
YSAINTWQMWDNSALSVGADNGYIGINLNTGVLTVVPEPSTWALVVGGVSTLFILRRRNRS